MSVLTTVDYPEPEFTDEQLGRLDELQEAAEQFIRAVAETDDIVWEPQDIWDLIYECADILQHRGRRVRIPTRVTNPAGKVDIIDWWEAYEDADMEHGGTGRDT